jgi:hypothetical protein
VQDEYGQTAKTRQDCEYGVDPAPAIAQPGDRLIEPGQEKEYGE